MWRGTAVQSLVHDLSDSPHIEEVGTGARDVHMWRGTAVQSWYTTCPIVLTLVGTGARAVHIKSSLPADFNLLLVSGFLI